MQVGCTLHLLRTGPNFPASLLHPPPPPIRPLVRLPRCRAFRDTVRARATRAGIDVVQLDEPLASACQVFAGGHFSSIQDFTCMNCKIDNEAMNAIVALPHLKRLTFNGSPLSGLSGSLASDLGRLFGRLESLNLSFCDITDAVLRLLAWAGLPALTQLYIEDNPALTDEGVAAVEAFANLEALSVADCEQLTDRAMEAFAVSEETSMKGARGPGLPEAELPEREKRKTRPTPTRPVPRSYRTLSRPLARLRRGPSPEATGPSRVPSRPLADSICLLRCRR